MERTPLQFAVTKLKGTRDVKLEYFTPMSQEEMRAKSFPFLFEDSPRAVMGVK